MNRIIQLKNKNKQAKARGFRHSWIQVFRLVHQFEKAGEVITGLYEIVCAKLLKTVAHLEFKESFMQFFKKKKEHICIY